MSRKAEAIVQAASKVFLGRGFAAATVDEIAACAGVSKRTIYKHFESKEALFSLIIVQTSGQLTNSLETSLKKGRDPRETLTELAREYVHLILSPQALDIYRLVVSESARFPDLARSFHQAGAQRVGNALAAYLEEWKARGAIEVDDTRMAADQFMGSCAGPLRLRALFNPAEVPSRTQLERWVTAAVDRFLAGVHYRPEALPAQAKATSRKTATRQAKARARQSAAS